jgi:hypothetical protein
MKKIIREISMPFSSKNSFFLELDLKKTYDAIVALVFLKSVEINGYDFVKNIKSKDKENSIHEIIAIHSNPITIFNECTGEKYASYMLMLQSSNPDYNSDYASALISGILPKINILATDENKAAIDYIAQSILRQGVKNWEVINGLIFMNNYHLLKPARFT